MKTINLETWDRKEHFLFFQRMDYPHYHVGADLDITVFKAKINNLGRPFSFSMTYAVTAALNQVEAFRYRLRQGRVVLHEAVHPCFAYLAPDRKYFKMVTADLSPDMGEFVTRAQNKALTQEKYFVAEDVQGRDDLIYISSLPKVSFTHLSHTVSFNKDDAVPRLSWGRYYVSGGRLKLPFNVQAHHGFVDGDHMGTYLEKLQEYLNIF